MDFNFRGIEFHSNRIWSTYHVEETMKFMERFSMNALIFHQNDLIDQLVFPLRYFSDDLMWERWPVRMHTIYQNRKYMNKVIRDGKKRGIDIYFEVKELSFHESLLNIMPELRTVSGEICPYNPFWLTFIRDKAEELCEAVPDFAGLVISIGTRESKVSVSTGGCGCNTCSETEKLEWYSNVIKAFYEPLSRHGKKLIIRDFSYTAEDQSLIVQASERCSKDIIISLKITPHDFYPTFPTNPHIGHTNNQPQYVEFDTWGQFYGMGFFPASVADDMKKRLLECKNKGVLGVWFRTDWEVMTECSVVNTLNMFNLYAAAMLSANVETSLDQVYRTWAQDGIVSPLKAGSYPIQRFVPNAEDAWKKLKEFMEMSWEVAVRSSYVRGHVFTEDAQVPETIKKAFLMMISIHGRDQWDPNASELVKATKENIKIILEEKEESKRIVRKLPEVLSPYELGIPKELADDLVDTLDLYTYYVDMIAVCTKACYLAQYAIENSSEQTINQARQVLPEIERCIESIMERLENTEYPHYVYWFLDELRLKSLYKDIEEKMNTLSNSMS
ncbi:MAG: hypothetical protein GX957_05565 [Clostridiaceae bacterium]|nr:hypothetical protein [Clostridiaceae bacterium]